MLNVGWILCVLFAILNAIGGSCVSDPYIAGMLVIGGVSEIMDRSNGKA